MEIRLDQIVDEPFEWSESRSIGAGSLDSDQLIRLSEVSWSGRVTALEAGHLLRARLRYEQELECPRCLATVVKPVDVEFEYLVVPRAEEPMTGEVELDEDDLGVLYVTEPILDTEPLLMEQLQLNIPMRQLCRDDCAGLCPKCGANRNAGECGCEAEVVDPRWSALAALRDQVDKD